jgi:hypothetical protein
MKQISIVDNLVFVCEEADAIDKTDKQLTGKIYIRKYSIDNPSNVTKQNESGHNSVFALWFKPSSIEHHLVDPKEINLFIKQHPTFERFIKEVILTKISNIK